MSETASLTKASLNRKIKSVHKDWCYNSCLYSHLQRISSRSSQTWYLTVIRQRVIPKRTLELYLESFSVVALAILIWGLAQSIFCIVQDMVWPVVRTRQSDIFWPKEEGCPCRGCGESFIKGSLPGSSEVVSWEAAYWGESSVCS